jgi:hypothetical protein
VSRERDLHHAPRDRQVANAWDWQPRRRYDFVRLGVDIVRPGDREELVRRVSARALADGGRLIVTHYRNAGEEPLDVASWLAATGRRVAGAAHAPGVSVAWIDSARDSKRG